MSNNYKNAASEREYTRVYENMRGVDFSEVPKGDADKRFGYLENMYVDYACGGSHVESIPGFRIIKSIGKRIHSIFSHRHGDGSEDILVHAGTYLYRFNSDNKDNLTSDNWELITNVLNDGDSSAIAFGDYIFILDGTKIILLTQDGNSGILGQNIPVYIPQFTMENDGDEDLNLLAPNCSTNYYIKSYEDVSHGSYGLTFKVTGDDEKYCEVTGIADDFSGTLYIPSYATVDGVRYPVKTIGSSAFRGNTAITELYTNDNLEIIEKYAFWGCSALKTVYLSRTVKCIEHHAFYNCTALATVYVGMNFEEFEVNCFEGCGALSRVCYASTAAATDAIIGKDRLGEATASYNVPLPKYVISIPVNPKIASINAVLLNARNISFTFDSDARQLIIEIQYKSTVANSTLSFSAQTKRNSTSGKFFSHSAAAKISPQDAIYKCTCGAVYDGRIFLSGNPLLPGYVFYSSIDKTGNVNPFYYSVNDFFVDGVGKYDVSSLLATQENLVVFKSGDDGSGSVFYHTPEIVNGRKEYPVSYTHKGVNVKGESYNFYDDTVFLTDMGLSAIERSSSGGAKRVICRSSNVNPKLFCEDIRKMHLTEWCGYLVASSGGRMYLADSRDKFSTDGSYEYEWYYLNGIGTYSGGTRAFRYKSVARSGYKVHPDIDKITSSEIQSYIVSSDNFVFYVVENGVKYEVYATEEYIGGKFSPATAVLGMGSLLYFGTESGDLCVFNNDKRGVAPEHIKNAADFDEAEYKEALGNRIHPDFYDFASRSPHYVVATAFDDCGMPDRRKSTSRASLVIKCKTYPRSRISADVSTDLVASRRIGEFSASALSFSDVDFGSFCATARGYSSIPLNEYERGWIEKRISLRSDEFRSPIGIYSIIYRYRVKGRIKSS
ncbi:MAG: leucine-rich repeat domain-containing protein [Clostridia bacterium]|nr:leucine-rich repeat domain-containing protein [Clostridia bacterium]